MMHKNSQSVDTQIAMRVEELLKTMTLKEKASLCSGEGYWFTKAVSRVGLDKIMITDGPHGLRRQVGAADHLGLNKSVPSTCFPAGATIANSWDIDLAKRLGELIADEAVAEGVHVVLGPAINIKRSPLCGRNFEYYSEDPLLAGKLAASYIRGLQSRGIAACPKHYAVNNQERLRMMIDAVVDERTLREIYLLPFEYAVKEGGAWAIMSSYNKVNGVYANEHQQLLDQILQREWGFDGVIISDWGASNDRVEGLIAGNQLEMPTTMGETDAEIVAAVRGGEISMELLDNRLRPLLTLMLETQKAVAQVERPVAGSNSMSAGNACTLQSYSKEAHHQAARELAEQSMVLLKNQDSILPLVSAGSAFSAGGTLSDASAVSDGASAFLAGPTLSEGATHGTGQACSKPKIAVIGDLADTPRYQGAGSSIVNPTQLDSPLESLQECEQLQVVGYAQGYKRYSKKSSASLVRKAVQLAKQSEKVVLFLGLDESTEAEGIDRDHMKLRHTQIELLEAIYAVHTEIVVVLSGGAAVDMSWDYMAKGVLHTYLGGQAVAKAIVNVLTGEVNPSGKLAETYAIGYEDIASSAYYPGGYQTTQHREGLYVGYRYFDTAGVQSKYPFGFGLSYTEFTYTDLRVEPKDVSPPANDVSSKAQPLTHKTISVTPPLQVTFTLTNTGARAGAEVCQLYVAAPDSLVFRPKKELKGFTKVFLEPGECKKVTITLDNKAFAYYNIQDKDWRTEFGTYRILVGGSSQDLPLSAEVLVGGKEPCNPYGSLALPSYYSGEVTAVSDKEFFALLGHTVGDTPWSKDMPITVNSSLLEAGVHPGLGRFLYRTMKLMRKCVRNSDFKKAAYLDASLYMPFRALARMSNGMMTMPMVEGLVCMINKGFFRGLRPFLKAWKDKKRLQKRWQDRA